MTLKLISQNKEGKIMSGQIEIEPIWKNSINFKVYELDRSISYDHLLECIKNYPGETESQNEGWLAKYPYFITDDKKSASFLYVYFKKEMKLSRFEGREIKSTQFLGLNFDFEGNLVIVSTTDRSKLTSLVEKRVFAPVREMTKLNGCSYSGDFLFWLAYKFDKDAGRINNDIFIDDIPSISSEREKFNLADAVTATTQVTNHIDAKVILGINQFANGLQLRVNAYNELYYFYLRLDGRIQAKPGINIETREQKALYAKQIHNIVQTCFADYSSIADTEQWNEEKGKYVLYLLQSSTSKLNEYVSEISKKYSI